MADSISFESLGSKTLEIKIDDYDGRFTTQEEGTYAASGNFILPLKGLKKTYVKKFFQERREMKIHQNLAIEFIFGSPLEGKSCL